MFRTTPILLIFALAAPGCAADDYDGDDAAPAGERDISLPAADAARILDLVNYPGTDAALLDGTVGLDSRAAAGIVQYRNGADGVAPSGDDNLFDNLAELDAIAYVGDTAFSKLQSYAALHPAPAAESVETVLFRGWESEAVVWGVNHSTASELDNAVELDPRAANGLAAGAPWKSVTAMGPVAYVGLSALVHLRGYAPTWWARMHAAGGGTPSLAGVYDGIQFDDATAHVAVDIANQATGEQMVAHGMSWTGAAPIVGNRPYTTLAAVSAVSGVGTATMRALHDYAASGQWAGPPPPDFVLTQEELTGMLQTFKESMWEDEGFADVVLGLAGHNDALGLTIMNALEAEADRLTAPLLGGHYPDRQTAADAVADTAAAVKILTITDGWTYLSTLGLTPPAA